MQNLENKTEEAEFDQPEKSKFWTEIEFNQAVEELRIEKSTRLSKRTLDACREVLMNGDEIEAVSKRCSILPAQIFRALKMFDTKKIKG